MGGAPARGVDGVPACGVDGVPACGVDGVPARGVGSAFVCEQSTRVLWAMPASFAFSVCMCVGGGGGNNVLQYVYANKPQLSILTINAKNI